MNAVNATILINLLVVATRLGFKFEGIFRQAAIYKGRNQDTALYKKLDREWPAVSRKIDKLLKPSNLEPERVS